MHRATISGSCLVLLAKLALAAPGDELVVVAKAVNLRAGPGKEYRVTLQVERHQRALELAREGAWVRVELAGRGEQGWIHESLLEVVSRAPPAAAPASHAASSARPEAAGNTAEPARPSAQEAGLPALPSLNTPAPEAPSQGEALARFRADVDDLNARARALAGVELFAGAEAAGNGAVHVLVTDAWRLVPQAGQESYTNALFDQWRAVAGGPGPLRLQVIDPSGRVVREKSGP